MHERRKHKQLCAHLNLFKLFQYSCAVPGNQYRPCFSHVHDPSGWVMVSLHTPSCPIGSLRPFALSNGFIAHPAVPVGRLRPFPWRFTWICQVALYLHMLPWLTETGVLAWFRQHLCRLVYVPNPMRSFFFLSFSLLNSRFQCSSTFSVGWQALPTVYK